MATAMIRKMHVALCPTEALRAMANLDPSHTDTSGVTALSERFRREIARELDRHADALDSLGRCIEWLSRKGIARVIRPRARGGPRVPTWLCPIELRADLHVLALAAGQDAPEGPARTSALALRAVLHTISVPGVLEVTAVRGGAGKAQLRDVIVSLESALSEAGVSMRGPLPPALRRVSVPITPAPTPPPRDERTVEHRIRAPRSAQAPVKAPPAAVQPPPPPVHSPPPATSTAGFGGLPDDAQPEDLRSGETLSARGLTPDAEFFLTEAGIAQWPCTSAELEKSRRVLMTRLHPDRAGEASTVTFHRVAKGHGDLARKLAVVTTTSASSTVVTPAPAPVPAPPPRTTVCEWPPRAEATASTQVAAR